LSSRNSLLKRMLVVELAVEAVGGRVVLPVLAALLVVDAAVVVALLVDAAVVVDGVPVDVGPPDH
jgi:hypothetical protein